MIMAVELNNLTENQIDQHFVKKVVEKVLTAEERPQESDVSIAFVGPGRMRKLNKAYRQKNRATDVLAFPESKVALEKFKIGPTKEVKGLGEIIICPREVKKNAKRFNTAFEKELTRVVVHGILHLLGCDHEKSEKEAKRMEEKEMAHLKALGFNN